MVRPAQPRLAPENEIRLCVGSPHVPRRRSAIRDALRPRRARERSVSSVLRRGDQEAATAIAVLANIQERGDPLEEVQEFIRGAAWILAYEGRAIYEIVPGEGGGQGSGIRVAKLELLPFGRVLHFGGRFLQWVPAAQREGGRRWIIIPTDRIWELRLPRSLGTARSQRRLIRELVRLSTLMPEFALRDLGQARDSGYEFEVHRREREIAVARVTQAWGWSARWSWREDATEYFQLWRELLFRRSLTMVRGHIVSELNRLLRRVGIDAELDVVQSASVHSIDGALERLAKGEWDFARATQEAGVR
jgi:hypothetical protein